MKQAAVLIVLMMKNMTHFSRQKGKKASFHVKNLASPPQIILTDIIFIFISLIISETFLNVYWAFCNFSVNCLFLSFAHFSTGVLLIILNFGKKFFKF